MLEEPKLIQEQKEIFGYPRLKFKWQSGGEQIRVGRKPRETCRILNMGLQGAGKSSLLEVFAVRFRKIIDLFGSCDGESLCWCKPQFFEFFKEKYGREPKILLIYGDGKKLSCKYDTMHVQEVKLKDIAEHDITTTTQMFYNTLEDYYAAIGQVISILKKRLYWDYPWALCIREAGDWGRARTKVIKDDQGAKDDLIRFYRQNRHHGLAVLMDTLRWTNIDKEIRDLSNIICVKKIGIQLLPKDMRFLYRHWKPWSLMKLPNHFFGIVTDNRSIGVGMSEYPNWHKEEKENILATTGIEILDNETNECTEDNRHCIGDLKHSEIIEKYIELKSVRKVEDATGKGKSAISEHIKTHNTYVKSKGECPKCKNTKSVFSKDYIITSKERPAKP